jgi:hypothetical protein
MSHSSLLNDKNFILDKLSIFHQINIEHFFDLQLLKDDHNLLLCFEYNKINIIEYLLKVTNKYYIFKEIYFYAIVKHNHIDLLKLLLKHGFKFNKYKSVLEDVVLYNNLEMLEFLFSTRQCLRLDYPKLLELSVKFKDSKIFCLLLKRYYNINITYKTIRLIIIYNDLYKLKLLINYGYDFEFNEIDNNYNATKLACEYGRLEILQEFYNNNVNLNNSELLAITIKFDHYLTMKYLLNFCDIKYNTTDRFKIHTLNIHDKIQITNYLMSDINSSNLKN